MRPVHRLSHTFSTREEAVRFFARWIAWGPLPDEVVREVIGPESIYAGRSPEEIAESEFYSAELWSQRPTEVGGMVCLVDGEPPISRAEAVEALARMVAELLATEGEA